MKFVAAERHRDARNLAVGLMARHCLFGWQFAFDGARRRHGSCCFARRRITLSRFFVAANTAEGVRLVILHEIAHALVGRGHGHDAVWRAKCLEIGGDGRRCCQGEMPKGPWEAVCPNCGKEFNRFRRPQPLLGWHCKACGQLRGPLSWKNASIKES